jgi:hypothetical protein
VVHVSATDVTDGSGWRWWLSRATLLATAGVTAAQVVSGTRQPGHALRAVLAEAAVRGTAVAPSGLRGCAGNCVDDGSGGDVEPVGDEVPGAHAMGAASSACTCGGGGQSRWHGLAVAARL